MAWSGPAYRLAKRTSGPPAKPPAMVAEATLGLFRRPDGAILMAIAHMNGDADTMPDMDSGRFWGLVAGFDFRSGVI